MSQHVYEYLCQYVIGPHMMFTCLDSIVWQAQVNLYIGFEEYFEIVGVTFHNYFVCEWVCVHACVCMRVCAWIRCMRLHISALGNVTKCVG